jgi:hypothetical protein
MSETSATPLLPSFERTADYVETYANSILYEQSAWDLKLILGRVDQSSGATVVKQHLAVTIPWPQAKLALFWLRLQVEAAEMAIGAKIPIRKDILPQEPPPLTPEQEKDPDSKRFYDLYVKLRNEFLGTT